MALPLSDSLSPTEAVRIVSAATGEDQQRVAGSLIEAGITGAIVATGCLHSSAAPNLKAYFAHPVLSPRQEVPAQYWGGQIDWARSRIGRYDLVRLDRSEIDRWLGATKEPPPATETGESNARHGAKVPSGEENIISLHTGLPGKPTAWHLIEAECRRRYTAGERHDKKAEWARALRAWVVSAHPGVAGPTEKTIANRLTDLLRELQNNPK